ncbi:isopenicillin N synthase family dioxygenase [uncultured Methylobacterium sp.]|uniref:isopenicillin N synthase family dioxygenase n=1 Tax=uncultured Methylobacterium sp. TaxID=157278 RepID=UPI0035CB5FC4
MSQLPLIDFSLAKSPDPAERKQVASALRAACIHNGFFYATHTGIPREATDDILAAAETFFARAEHEKRAVSSDLSLAGRGYERLRGQRLEAGAQADLKEGFMVGLDLPADDWRVQARWSHHGPNVWPAHLPGWRERVEGYYARMLDLAGTIMRTIALSLEVEETYFDACFVDSIASLRLLHYPPQPAEAGADARGAGAHTDWGAITILLQDEVGGLQVKEGDGWIEAPPLPGAFVVNLGDLMPRWTNGLYRSTVHRVINRSGRERYSVPFFFDGRGDYVSQTVPTCLRAGESPRYAPLSVSEHLAEMVRLTRAA